MHKWFEQARTRLLKWSKKYLIHDGADSNQTWTTAKIIAETPTFIKRIWGSLIPILTMDGTYVATQNTNDHHGLRHMMWSGQKKYICVSHILYVP